MAEEINKTYTSNSLYNDSTGVIAFAEQLKQELINWANYQHVTEELGQNRPNLQNELNNLFLSVYERFLTFLNDADASEEAINTWKEIENFLADYTDEKTLAAIVAELNNKIESRLTVPLESTTGSSTTSTMTQKAITETIDASNTFTTGEKVDNVGIDSEPIAGSDNLVRSGGVKEFEEVLNKKIVEIKGGDLNTTSKHDYCVLKTIDGTLYETNHAYNRGTTDFIKTPSSNRILIKSNGCQPGSLNYCICSFYSEDNEDSFLSSVTDSNLKNIEVTDYEISIPQNAEYVRFSIYNKSLPIIIELDGALSQMQQEISEVQQNVESLNDKIQGQTENIPAASDYQGYYVLNSRDGSVINASSSASANRGVSDFVEVSGYKFTVISGVRQPGNIAYCALAFYSSNSDDTFLSSYIHTTTNVELQNIEIQIPSGANYVRFTLNDYRNPAIVKFQSELDKIPSIQQDIAEMQQEISEVQQNSLDFPQIRNNNLPTKTSNEELNILLLGSSWGVDSIAALADICNNVGVPVNTGNMYKSGGTIAQYLEDVANNRTNIFFYNHGGINENLGRKTVLQALQYKVWDIIIVMNSAVDSGGTGTTAEIEGVNIYFAKWLRYLKKNCSNSKVCFVINSTWTGKNEYTKLDKSFKIVRKLMKQSGISIINPAGSAITYARTHTSLDTTNNLYRDSLHLNRGIGRFITAATMYYQLVYPIYGIGLDNCTITGHWDEAATGTYSDIDVDADNIATCIECAKEGVCNQFYLNLD